MHVTSFSLCRLQFAVVCLANVHINSSPCRRTVSWRHSWVCFFWLYWWWSMSCEVCTIKPTSLARGIGSTQSLQQKTIAFPRVWSPARLFANRSSIWHKPRATRRTNFSLGQETLRRTTAMLSLPVTKLLVKETERFPHTSSMSLPRGRRGAPEEISFSSWLGTETRAINITSLWMMM